MIGWRALAYDLRTLSNGAFLYPTFYLLGLGAYFLSFGATSDQNLLQAIPLLGLTMCALSHLANEQADRVADRITVELGGYRRRLATRMVAVTMCNIALLSVGLILISASEGWRLKISPLWWPTALALVIVFSTLGVLVAAALPHPLFSVVGISVILFAGGMTPDENFQIRLILEMISSDGWPNWLGELPRLVLPWALAAIILTQLRLGRFALQMPTALWRRKNLKIKTPTWVTWKSTPLSRTFLITLTNPIPILATIVSLAIYTYGTLVIAAKYAELHVATNAFPMFTGILLVNVIPALMLANSVQRREVNEQESFLHNSQAQALRTRVGAQAFIVGLCVLGLLAIIASTTGTPLNSSDFVSSAIELFTLAPSLAFIALSIADRINTPTTLALASYALTLPELLLSRLFPQLIQWFPSSIISRVAGGQGLYAQNATSVPPNWPSIALLASLAILPIVILFRFRK